MLVKRILIAKIYKRENEAKVFFTSQLQIKQKILELKCLKARIFSHKISVTKIFDLDSSISLY